MVAKSGDRLLLPDAQEAYVRDLFPAAALLTPNLAEAEAFLGRRVRDIDAMRDAARRLFDLGPRAVLVKGGHLDGDPVDVLWDGRELVELPGPRIVTRNTHGTGCTYSAAIASRLGLGASLHDAVAGARAYLTEAIRRSYSVGRGHGPVDHLHTLSAETAR
jgi:hydroxymethylpyrimidine/phosphomethylpyrimidine kinase